MVFLGISGKDSVPPPVAPSSPVFEKTVQWSSVRLQPRALIPCLPVNNLVKWRLVGWIGWRSAILIFEDVGDTVSVLIFQGVIDGG